MGQLSRWSSWSKPGTSRVLEVFEGFLKGVLGFGVVFGSCFWFVSSFEVFIGPFEEFC